MLRAMLLLVILGVVLIGGVGAIKAEYQGSVEGANDELAYNESINVSGGTLVELNESNRDVVYGDTVTVTESGSTVDDSEYEWNEHNGTLFVPSGSSLANNEAYVNYSLHEPTNQQKLARDIQLMPANAMGDSLFTIGSIAMLLGSVVVMMRMGGR